MPLRTQHEFLFVGRDEGGFVENYAYDLAEGGDNSGKIFITIEVQNNPVDAEAIGETVFDTVRRNFFADLEKEPYIRFEDAVRAANKALVKMREEKKSGYLGNLHVMIAAIVDNTLYLTQTGEAEAYLVRRRLCSTITDGLAEDASSDYFANIASGTLEPGDFMLLCSTRLLRYIAKTDLAKIVSSRNLISSLGELKDYLSTEVLGRVGLVGIGVQETAPSLNDGERGKVTEHLQKEEMHAASSATRRSADRGVSAMRDALSGLTKVVADLKDRVSAMGSRSVREARQVRAEGVKGAGSFLRRLNRDQLLGLIIVVILFLTVGIWWMHSAATEQKQINELNAKLEDVREEISSAETTGQYNKDQAGEMLAHAEQQAIEVLNSGFHRAKANELLELIYDARDALDGVLRPEPRVVVDLALKRENVSALGLLSQNDVLYAFEYNALYPILLDQVQDPLTIDNNETVVAATVYDDDESLLFFTKSGKVIEFKDNRMSFLDTDEGQFKRGVDVEAYSNKFYVLSPEDNQIWRYTRFRDSFDNPEAYNVNADVKDAVSMAIDGNIYVLNKDGFITKLFRGSKEDFPIKKQPIGTIENPTKIYTELDMSQIFVLDPAERRVLVYVKDARTGGASYSNQMVFDDLPDLRDLYFDKDTSKLYLLDQSRVYEVTL